VTFVTAGYPTADDTVQILLAMERGGADIVELGVPFSDPIADGPAIQESNMVCWTEKHHCGVFLSRATQIALKNNVDYPTVLGQLREARAKGLTVPVLLMGMGFFNSFPVDSKHLAGYYNPLLAYGEDKSIQDASEAGANGFIVVDLPPEESIAFRQKCAKAKYV
jgi:tryptophan synthase